MRETESLWVGRPPRHRRLRVGVYARRHERQHERRALGIVGFFSCGGGGGNGSGNGATGTRARGMG